MGGFPPPFVKSVLLPPDNPALPTVTFTWEFGNFEATLVFPEAMNMDTYPSPDLFEFVWNGVPLIVYSAEYSSPTEFVVSGSGGEQANPTALIDYTQGTVGNQFITATGYLYPSWTELQATRI